MKARGIYRGGSSSLQTLALAVKGLGLLINKRKALDFCKVFPNDRLFYYEEAKGDCGVMFVLYEAKFI
jgi:hypothetical protein